MREHRLNEAWRVVAVIVEDGSQRFAALELDLAISPTRDLNDGVDDGSVILIGVERDLLMLLDSIKHSLKYAPSTHIMPKANGLALVQQPDPPVESVATTDLPQTDSAVVELAIILTIVDASSGTVVLVILVISATRNRRR